MCTAASTAENCEYDLNMIEFWWDVGTESVPPSAMKRAARAPPRTYTHPTLPAYRSHDRSRDLQLYTSETKGPRSNPENTLV